MSGDATPIQPGMDVVIRDVLVPAVDIVRPDESVRVVHRRMEGEALRSLIVVDEGRPVGVIQWRDIMRPNDGEPEQVVSDLMHQAFPVCTENMTLDEARTRFGAVDFDRIPVVDAAGLLVGEVKRTAVVPPSQPEQPGVAIADGMSVVGSAGTKLGTVSEVILGPAGQLQAFAVEHGFLGRKHKQLPPSVIAHTEGEALVLNIDESEFKLLADREQ